MPLDKFDAEYFIWQVIVLIACLFLYYLVSSELKSKILLLDITMFKFENRMYVRLHIEYEEWLEYNKCEMAIELINLAPMVREMETSMERMKLWDMSL